MKNIDLNREKLYKLEIGISDTYEYRFLSHKDSGNKIRDPRIKFPQIAGLWSVATKIFGQ